MRYDTWVKTEAQKKKKKSEHAERLHLTISTRSFQWWYISWTLDLSARAPPSGTCATSMCNPSDPLQSRSLPVVSSAGCRSGAVPVPRPGAGLWQRPAPRSPGGGCKCHHDVSQIDISAGFNLKQLRGGFHPEAWQGTRVSQSLAFPRRRVWLWPTDWLFLWLDTLMGALCDSSQGG